MIGLSCLGLRRVVAPGPLVGFAEMHISGWRMRLYQCPCFLRDGQASVALPSKAMIGADGLALRDDRGKARFEPVVAFDDPALARRFSTAAVEAIEIYDPGFFGQAELFDRPKLIDHHDKR